MSGRIPQNFIDDLLGRVDIVELIDSYVPLKKQGREYVACCPFHGEKTPSFTVSPTKQFYHCFGCGAHGTALGFLMAYDHLHYIEAIEALAQKLGLEVPREGQDRPSVNYADDYDLLAQASEFYQKALRSHPRAIEYLKARGLSGQIAKDFGLGYAPAAWDPLTRHLRSHVSLERLVDTGLIIRTDEGRHYDRFRNRIMFPIRDRRGRVIGFGGRVLDDSSPKYLNSPETPLFHKGRSLYGWYESRKVSADLHSVVVVEGYMDVVALAQHDVKNAVATLGTATTREHIQQLYRTVSEIVFCFDGDRAGREAAWRAVQNLLPEYRDGLEARLVFLPEGEDPDSLVRKEGSDGWHQTIGKAMRLDQYLLSRFLDNQNLSGASGRARLVEHTKPILEKLADGVFKERLLDEIAKLAKLSVDRLFAPRVSVPETSRHRPDKFQIHRNPVRMAIAVLLNRPALATQVTFLNRLKTLRLPGISLLVEIIEIIQSEPHLNAAAVIERFRNSENHQHLLKLMKWKPPQAENGGLGQLFDDVMGWLEKRCYEQRAEELLSKERVKGLSSHEKDELQHLLSLLKRSAGINGQGVPVTSGAKV